LKVSVGGASEMRIDPNEFAIDGHTIKRCLQDKIVVKRPPMRFDRCENLQRNTKIDGAQCRERIAMPFLLTQT
jgi:hypothetical protein